MPQETTHVIRAYISPLIEFDLDKGNEWSNLYLVVTVRGIAANCENAVS